MCNGCRAPSWEWHCDSESAIDTTVFVFPHSVDPFKRYDQIKAFLWLKGTSSCNHKVSPTVCTVLNGSMCIVNGLVMIKVDVEKIRVVSVKNGQDVY